MAGSQVFFCSSLPKWMILATPSCEACTIAPIAPLTLDSSSMMMVLARCPTPMPPCSLLIVAPSQPCRAISRDSSRWTERAVSIAGIRGRTSVSANSRTWSRNW